MLVHICCSVDSHYFLQRLRGELPDEPLVGYFYDPNIHPYSEYILRYADVKRSCKMLGVELILGEYEYSEWLSGTKGLENEPEKGKRCEYCFDFRVGKSAQMAKKLGHKSITTTLLMSPKKDISQLKSALEKAISGSGLEAYAPDFRAKGGTQAQFALAKADKLYHQNYCGCIYALARQRQAQGVVPSELFSDIAGRVLAGSINERLRLYLRVSKASQKGQEYWLKRVEFLNYRLLFGLVKIDKIAQPSHFFSYSNFKAGVIKFALDESQCQKGVVYGLKNGVVLMDLEHFNALAKKSYASLSELARYPLGWEQEIDLRKKIMEVSASQNPIIVLPNLRPGRYEIQAKAEFYNDSKEILKIKTEL